MDVIRSTGRTDGHLPAQTSAWNHPPFEKYLVTPFLAHKSLPRPILKTVLMSTHFRPLQVNQVRKETRQCVSIAFEVPEKWEKEFQYQAGQNLTIKRQFGAEDLRRSFSICSSPLEPELRIAVKQVPGGIFSNFALHELKAGDILEVLPPTGKFFTPLDPRQSKQYLALAAGSGITPVLSLIKTTLTIEPRSRFTLFYGNRSHQDIIFREQLEGIKNKFIDRFNLHFILSREKTASPFHHGRMDARKCREIFGKLVDPGSLDEVFICGPEAMISEISGQLKGMGMPARNIHFELFTVPGQDSPRELIQPGRLPSTFRALSHVSLQVDGITHSFDLAADGLPILEAALLQGIDLPYACKGGVCSSCRAKLLEGRVTMDNNYALEPDELEAGFILTCQAHPDAPGLLIDFDAK